MTKDDFNAWLAAMGWDRHGGRSEAAKALGVSTEQVRKLAAGEASISRQLAVTMATLRYRREEEEERAALTKWLDLLTGGQVRMRERDVDTTDEWIAEVQRRIAGIDRFLKATAAD